MKDYIWVVLDRYLKKRFPVQMCIVRSDARSIAKYWNGFAHRTKKARYVVKKYKEV